MSDEHMQRLRDAVVAWGAAKPGAEAFSAWSVVAQRMIEAQETAEAHGAVQALEAHDHVCITGKGKVTVGPGVLTFVTDECGALTAARTKLAALEAAHGRND